MEFLGFLAPIAFVFALSALAESRKLKSEFAQLKMEMEELKGK